MKNTLRLMSLTAAIIASTLIAKAQTTPAHKFRLGFGAEAGIPTGNASNYTTFTLGGTGRLQYGVTNSFALTLTTGAYHFFPKFIPGTSTRYTSYGVAPVKAGFKVFVTPGVYLNAEAGAGFEITEAHFFKGGQTKLLLSPGVGYANKHWDFGFRYESLTGDQNNYGLAGVRIAYGFDL